MKLTGASEFGCLALLAIAEAYPDFCKRQEISERYHISPAYLEQILRRLTVSGIITSKRGRDGGFALAREPRDVLIAEIVRAMEGPLAPVTSVSENFYSPSPVEASPAFHSLFRKVRDAVALILESTTLEDVVQDERNQKRKQSRSGTHRRASGTRANGTRSRA